MKILITGGCGFIGVNLVEFLLEKTDWTLRILDNLSTGKVEDLKKIKNYSEDRIEFVKGDITKQEDVEKAMKDCEKVVNLAAQTSVIDSIEDPLNDAETNIIGIIKLLQQAVKEKVERFVHASSAAVLGEQEMPMHEGKVPQPLCPYGASKLSGEAYCSVFSATNPLTAIALRFSNVYGPRSHGKGSVIPKFIKQILNEETLTVFGDGEQTRDFVYVKDICNGIYLALTKEMQNKFELIQLGTGEETSVNYLFERLEQEFKELRKEVKKENKPERTGEIIKNYTDISKAKKILGYSPEMNFEEGLRLTVKEFSEK